MNKGIAVFLAFCAGSVGGFIAGKKMLEQHYEQVVQEEIDSVKQAFRKQVNKVLPKEKKEAEKKNQAETGKPSPKPKNEKKDYRTYYPEKKEAKEDTHTGPYVIKPIDFDTIKHYEAISLKVYADGVVVDDEDNPMSEEDIEETIGRESLEHFGEYEPDSVFVRNDEMRTDYEILRDEQNYKP